VVYNKVNLMLPTYHRFDNKLPKFIKSALDKCSSKSTICFTFCVNEKDKETEYVIHKLLKDEGVDYEIIFETLERPHLAKYFNMMYEKTKFQEESTVVSMLGDDMEFWTQGFDIVILKALNAMGGLGLVYGDDCLWWHEKLCVNLFTTRTYVDLQAPFPFMCEYYPRDQIDIVWYKVARAMGMIRYLDHLKLSHNHATQGDCRDATFDRLVKEDKTVIKNLDKMDNYISECVSNMLNKIGEQTESSVDVIMTTYNRHGLLKETVESLKGSAALPLIIHVFDDCSDDFERIEKIFKDISKNVVIHRNKKRLGCEQNTPAALKFMFEKNKSKSVVILDSDTQFSPVWWINLNRAYKDLGKTKNFGSINMLNLPNNPPGKICRTAQNMLEKNYWGACGALITKSFYTKYIKEEVKRGRTTWDNDCSRLATKDGKINYVMTPSMVQHTGVFSGTHLGGKNAYARDFGGTQWCYHNFAMNPSEKNGMVLYSCLGRYGDIFMNAIIINMLRDRGYYVRFMTLPYYVDFAKRIMNGTMVIPQNKQLLHPGIDWSDMSTKQMSEWYPGYSYYINAQPGSQENHDILLGSGLHMANFIKSRVESILDIDLPSDYKEYIPTVECDESLLGKRSRELKSDKPLCIIAPEVSSIPTLIDGDKQNELYEKYKDDYNVRILTVKRPEVSPGLANERYLYGLSIVECIALMQKCELLIANDSGLAWIAMSNRNCKKIIYHRMSRLLETNVWYSQIDPMAEDVVVE